MKQAVILFFGWGRSLSIQNVQNIKAERSFALLRTGGGHRGAPKLVISFLLSPDTVCLIDFVTTGSGRLYF